MSAIEGAATDIQKLGESNVRSVDMMRARVGYWVVAALGAVAAALALWQGPWLSHTADSFYHLAAIRSMLLKGELFPTLPMYPERGSWPDPTSSLLHSLLALVSLAADADPLTVWRWWHPLAAALSGIALARFAWVATGTLVAAPLAVTVQMLAFGGVDQRAAAYPSQIALALLWVGLTIAVSGGSAWLLAVTVAVLAAVHVGVASAALIALAVLGGATALAEGPRGLLRLAPSIALGVAAIAVRSVPLASPRVVADVRVGTPAYPATAPPPADWAPTMIVLPTPLGELAVPVAPAALVALAVMAALVVVPWMRVSRRRSVFVALTALALSPFAIVALGLPTGAAYAAGRASQVLAELQPVVVAWVLVELGPLIVGGTVQRRAAAAVGAAGVLWFVAFGSAAALGPLLAPPARGSQSFAESRAADLSVRWRDRVDALPRGSTLIASPDVGYQMAGLGDVFLAATPKTHTPAEVARTDGWLRRGDVLDLVHLSADRSRIASIAERLGAGYLLVDDSSYSWPTWRDAPPPIFARVAAGTAWLLFKYDRAQFGAYLDVPMNTRPDGILWGVQPAELLAGEVSFARVEGALPGTRVLLRDTAGQIVASGAAGAGIVPLRIPTDARVGWYELSADPPDRPSIRLALLPVGHEYEAESMSIPDLARRQPPGWVLYEQSFYGRQVAARASDYATAGRTIPTAPPGRYSVQARVYSFAQPGANELEVHLGDAAGRYIWSAGTNAPRTLTSPVELSQPVSRIEMTVIRQGQPFVIVDWLRVFPG